jgi:hypothetical protein
MECKIKMEETKMSLVFLMLSSSTRLTYLCSLKNATSSRYYFGMTTMLGYLQKRLTMKWKSKRKTQSLKKIKMMKILWICIYSGIGLSW